MAIDLNKLSDEMEDALERARMLAEQRQQAFISPAHILYVLLDKDTSLAATLEPYSWPIPSLPSHGFANLSVGGADWFLVGDAAGLVDPVTREGIYFALQSGEWVTDAVSSGDPPGRYHERSVLAAFEKNGLHGGSWHSPVRRSVYSRRRRNWCANCPPTPC